MSLRVRLFTIIVLGLFLIGGISADQLARAQGETGELLPSEPVVTAEIFTAFTCPYCRAFSTDTLPRLRAEYAGSVRFVIRPIAWDEAQQALAVAAECARQQGLFWMVYEPLYRQSEATDPSVMISLAGDYGLDTTRFSTCLTEPVMAQIVKQQTQELADREGRGVPTAFIAGEEILGAQPYDVFAAAIDQALVAAPSPPVWDSRWLSSDQQSVVDDFGYPDVFRLMEVDDLDGHPARYEYWTYFKGNVTYLFREGMFLSATDKSYPEGGVQPVPYRPEQFMLGESAQDVVNRLGLEDVGSFAIGNELLPGGELVASDRLLLGFLDERLAYVETFATTLGGER